MVKMSIYQRGIEATRDRNMDKVRKQMANLSNDSIEIILESISNSIRKFEVQWEECDADEDSIDCEKIVESLNKYNMLYHYLISVRCGYKYALPFPCKLNEYGTLIIEHQE